MTKQLLHKTKLLLTLLGCFLFIASVNSVQAQSVSGTVLSSTDNQPLNSVTVHLVGSNRATITDGAGHYNLSGISANDSLSFSFVGFKTETVAVNGRTTININLLSTTASLDQVVVVGYGTQKKVNLTGAVSALTSKDLSAVPTPNVSTLFYGKLPGLVPLQRGGQPGADDVSLSIRGFSNALVVVDGIAGRDFSRLDPSEIESVTILKDAASASVYGVSGGNGVILVTTKRGVTGKPIFNYTMNYGVQNLTKFPRQVTSEEYAILMNQSAVNLGGAPVYTQDEIQKFKDGTDPLYPNFDFYKYFIRKNTPQMQQNISVRGGNERIKYYFLLSQTSQSSMWRTDGDQGYKKYNFRSNVDAKITDNLSISVDFDGRVENRDNSVADSYIMPSWLYYSSPIYNPKNPDGTLSYKNYGLTAYLNQGLSGYNRNEQNVYEGALTIKYKIPFVEGLSVNIKASRDMYFMDGKDWEKIFNLYSWDEATKTSTQVGTRGYSALTLSTSKSSSTHIQSYLDYSRTFAGVHHVKGLLLHEVSEDKETDFAASRQGYVLPIDQIFAGPDLYKDNSGGASNNGREGYVGRVNYDYSGKYLFEYSFRYDGSAKFPPGKRWGYFSGVSAGWRISEEDFIKNHFPAIDNLKVRGSWGKLGSDNTGNFQFLSGYSYPSRSYILGGSTVTRGITESGTPNPNITWEESQMVDLGVDMSLWKGLLEMEADVFYRTRGGLLATRATQLPSTYGATLPSENLNSDEARGFEISLAHSSNIGKVKYRLSTNLSYSRQKNRHVEERTFNNQYDNWRNNENNRSQDVFWGYKAIGQFQSIADIYSSPIQDGSANSTLRPGDIKYDDFNKDGVINDMDVQPIGRGGSPNTWIEFESTPLLNYGFGINVVWKKFTVDMNWAGASGFNLQQAYNAVAPFKDGRSANAYLLDNWHHQDPSDPNSVWIPGKYPSTVVNGASNNLANSSFWLKNGTYLRLKSLNISYDLEMEFLKKHGVQGLAVTLSGQNLLTFSGLGEIDPESREALGAYYPQQMTYNIGLRATF